MTNHLVKLDFYQTIEISFFQSYILNFMVYNISMKLLSLTSVSK
jgi:hypothetical protein